MNLSKYNELDGYTVVGTSIQSVVMDGFSSFSMLASRLLLEEKLGKDDGTGAATFLPGEWYPLRNFLRAIDRVSREYGDYTLKQMGLSVTKYVQFPPHVTDIDGALGSINIAYHINHGYQGEPLFSPATGAMREGIGSYKYERVSGRKQITFRIDSPYPCAFDEGLLLGVAQRFERTATIKHEPGSCRKIGGKACCYTITWR